MADFFKKLFDTSDFPARWNCGNWESFHGWLHILSDVMIWAAYFMIPTALTCYCWKKRDEMEFPKLFWLFAAFIFSCGITHLIEATLFYVPIYRVSAVMKFTTAVVSWMTVFAIIRITPLALSLPGRAKLSDELRKQLDEKHIAEERLEKTNRDLEAYTARVAHDLRNPLSGLILLGDLVAEAVQRNDTKTASTQLDFMLESLRRMESSVKELHTLSLNDDESRMAPIALGTVMEKVVQSLDRKLSEAGARLRILSLPTIVGNDSLLVHLFTNLVENSMKYGGLEPTVITVEGRTAQDMEIVTVTDNGMGIPAEELGRIFEPKFRASNAKEIEGSGIGLSLCLSIMTGHHATISARSEMGVGTVVEMRFPKIGESNASPQSLGVSEHP